MKWSIAGGNGDEDRWKLAVVAATLAATSPLARATYCASVSGGSENGAVSGIVTVA